MSLFVASLNSGSNGNCYYIASNSEAILIDAGISCRETERRLRRLGLTMQNVRAIFITHEHSDHIYGLPSINKKYRIPIYISTKTLLKAQLKGVEAYNFNPYEPIRVGDLTIRAFPVPHDAQDPHNFIVSNKAVNVGVFTDIGNITEHVIHNFEQCHAAFLESNYDIQLLNAGSYPIALKNRIRDGFGHLSNLQAAKLFVDHRPPYMSHLFLSHLSRNNNSTEIVRNLFNSLTRGTEIVIASRYKETKLYAINANGAGKKEPYRGIVAPVQLDLF
ncbi:MAG TPA: MBL fold metallo-hydrolase [Cyclobacteriaceae bacterium]|nr:MBL fold metallo-hydrolase [Cyclobacteriaceae bacterium]HRW98153.1 MBL fold metallo-hydrolase [Cyclobacteriaceae bacterium]